MNQLIPLCIQIPGTSAQAGSTQWVFWIAIIVGVLGLLVLLLPVFRGLWMRFFAVMS